MIDQHQPRIVNSGGDDEQPTYQAVIPEGLLWLIFDELLH